MVTLSFCKLYPEFLNQSVAFASAKADFHAKFQTCVFWVLTLCYHLVYTIFLYQPLEPPYSIFPISFHQVSRSTSCSTAICNVSSYETVPLQNFKTNFSFSQRLYETVFSLCTSGALEYARVTRRLNCLTLFKQLFTRFSLSNPQVRPVQFLNIRRYKAFYQAID